MVTVRGSDESVEARLRAGLVACWCGGALRPWGDARPRRGGAVARPVAAAGSVTGDALAALEAVTAGLRRRFGGLDTVAVHEVAAHLTGGMLLAPAVPVLAGNTTLAAMAAAGSS